MSKKFSLDDLFSSISKLISEPDSGEKKLSPQQQLHQLEIENSILIVAAEIIRCDRNFSEDTEIHILEYLTKHFGAAGKKRRVQSVARHVEMGTEAFIKMACTELKILTTYDSRLNILHFLFGVAAADDFINAKEARCVHRIAGYLGITATDFAEIKTGFLNRNNPYTVLEIDEGASLRQVKTAYRKMILKYHPDKAGGKLSQQDAEERFREVQRAYEIICRELQQ